MDVRCHSDTEAARVSKNAHKESREIKGAEGSLPAAFLKEPQGAFSASGAAEDCNKSKPSTPADPDYCRRILVRGRDEQGRVWSVCFGGDPRAGAALRADRGGLPPRTSEKVAGLPLPGARRPQGPEPGARRRALSRGLAPPRPRGPAGQPQGEPRGCVDPAGHQAAASDWEGNRDSGSAYARLRAGGPAGSWSAEPCASGRGAPHWSAGLEEPPLTARPGPGRWRAGPRALARRCGPGRRSQERRPNWVPGPRMAPSLWLGLARR